MRIQGHFLNGVTSKRAPAYLEVVRGSDNRLVRLTISGDDSIDDVRDFQYNDLKIESRLGNTPREIVIQDQCLFISADHAGIDALTQAIHPRPKAHGLIHQFESNLLIVFAAMVVCGLFSWFGIVYGVPKAANYIAFQMPDFAQEKAGGSLFVLDKTLFKPSELSDEEKARVLALTEPYNQQFNNIQPKLNFRLGMGANAFALPSGDIVFTDDFVRLAQSDDELLAVYLHELGHLSHKHMTRRALQAAMLSIVVLLITGDIEQFDLIIGLPALLADLSYSRDFEHEADSFAFNAMQQNNIPLENFSNIMQRLEDFYSEEEGETEKDSKEPDNDQSWLHYLSTHPGTQERIQRANALIEANR